MTEITTEIKEAVEALTALVDEPAAHWSISGEPGDECVDVQVADLRALLSELTRLQEENSQLRLAICGGEDAPGYADSLPLADILGVAANNLGSWREASDRAARLQEAAEPFLRLAHETVTPVDGERPWYAESGDWMVVFCFAGQSVTLGDLRKAAPLATLQGQQS